MPRVRSRLLHGILQGIRSGQGLSFRSSTARARPSPWSASSAASAPRPVSTAPLPRTPRASTRSTRSSASAAASARKHVPFGVLVQRAEAAHGLQVHRLRHLRQGMSRWRSSRSWKSKLCIGALFSAAPFFCAWESLPAAGIPASDFPVFFPRVWNFRRFLPGRAAHARRREGTSCIAAAPGVHSNRMEGRRWTQHFTGRFFWRPAHRRRICFIGTR